MTKKLHISKDLARSLGVISNRGEIAGTALLFPEGLT